MARADQVEKTIRKVMKLIEDFTVDELLDLRFDLEERIESLKQEISASTNDQEKERKTTIREEYKRCGKPSCRCNTEGELHGPYLYEYWKEDGRTRSRYIGKQQK